MSLSVHQCLLPFSQYIARIIGDSLQQAEIFLGFLMFSRILGTERVVPIVEGYLSHYINSLPDS